MFCVCVLCWCVFCVGVCAFVSACTHVFVSVCVWMCVSLYCIYGCVCKGNIWSIVWPGYTCGRRWQSIWPPSTVFTSKQSAFNSYYHQALVCYSAMPIGRRDIYKRIRVCRKEGSVLRNRKVEVRSPEAAAGKLQCLLAA